MQAPRGGAEKTDVKHLEEERAAVHLPSIFSKGPIHGLSKKLRGFLLKIKSKTKLAPRRLRIEGLTGGDTKIVAK
ncbi:hypothetical protein GQ600_5598 [Phytophthora cactorum]|nr:hypothetical protein GQ600_5598 [Phytophthora cactorum]